MSYMEKTAKIIDGKAHAAAIRAEVKARIEQIAPNKRHYKKPALAVILVGDDPASLAYIKGKQSACEEVGIDFQLHKLPDTAKEHDVASLINKLNHSKPCPGILLQQPLPAYMDKNSLLEQINPTNDVDCLNPLNLGRAMNGEGRRGTKMLPCTPAGIITLLKRENIQIPGKRAVIVGRSEIVGKPLAFLMLQENATVTICHSHTQNLPEICRDADILVSAVGVPKFITADFVKPGAVVIDVGVNRINSDEIDDLSGEHKTRLCGDVDFDNVAAIASYITPVPGGVGPMTVATLMENCVKAWEVQDV